MSFSRPISEQIERLSNVGGSNLQQMEGLSEAVVMAIKETQVMMERAIALWSKGGVGAKVLGAEGNEVVGSRYGKIHWLRLQTALNAFNMAMAAPITVLPGLALVDGEGQVVAGEDGNPQRPFGAMNVSVLSGLMYSITDILWIEPGEPA